jgi:hypothetical protein
MTHPPESDRRLVEFLQQHRPEAPPPGSDLKQRLLAQIESSELQQKQFGHPASARRSSRWNSAWAWVVPPAVAAACLAIWVWPRPTITSAELAELEDYVTTSWVDVVDAPAEPLPDWLEMTSR